MQNKINQESGRSMVEMLGVLAVIGVLSVGGIAGYTNAMNKHRANELLLETMKRATIIATQMMKDDEQEPNLSEFSESVSGHTITAAKVEGADKFTLSISGVSEGVCSQMKSLTGTNSVIRDFKPDACADNATVVLTYNNDLSNNDSKEEENEDPSSCKESGNCDSNEGLCEGYFCKFSTSKEGCVKSATGDVTPVGTVNDYGDFKGGAKMHYHAALNYCEALKTMGQVTNGVVISKTDTFPSSLSMSMEQFITSPLKEGNTGLYVFFFGSISSTDCDLQSKILCK